MRDFACGLCGEATVQHDADHVGEIEGAPNAGFHARCAQKIADALAARGRPYEEPAVASGDLRVGDGTAQLEPLDVWKQREMSDRLDALEDLTRRVASVWRLWLSDAESGSICPGTFDAMKNLLGIERS